MDAFNDIGEVCKAANLAPAYLRTLAELEQHMQHAVIGQAAFGSLGAMSDSREQLSNLDGAFAV